MAQKIITLKQVGTLNDVLVGEDEIISYVEKVSPKSTGTQDSIVASELNDSTATFIADGVLPGDVVSDETGLVTTRVASVDSETTLTLDDDIFTASEDYRVGGSYDMEYDAGGPVGRVLKVGDSIGNVIDASTNAILTGDGIYVNVNRVNNLTENGSSCDISYRAMGIDLRIVNSTDSKATVLAAINAL